MRNHEVTLCFTRARARLARFLHDLAHKLGEPSAYYDGAPAGRLLDDVVCELEAKGVPKFDPRDPSWPLQPHERIRRFLISPGWMEFPVAAVYTNTGMTPEACQSARWLAEVIGGRPALAPAEPTGHTASLRAELERLHAEFKRTQWPPPNSMWRHYNGGVYRVEYVMDGVVHYVAQDDGTEWTRPVAEWNEHVERDGYVGPRFTEAPAVVDPW